MPQKEAPKIDVFINLHKKDIPALPLCVQSISRYLFPKPNRIIILSDDMPAKLLTEHGLEHIHESAVFDDFSLAQMPKIIVNGLPITGWYFQQFLKWEARRHTDADDYAVIDADTVFLKPITLIQEEKYVFYRSNQFNMPYFRTYEKLFGYFPERQKSYIADFMILNTKIIEEIIAKINERNNKKKWYENIIDAIDKTEPNSFSEFETYGYYMSKYFPNLFHSVKYRNKILELREIPYHNYNKIFYKLRGYASISYHNYNYEI